MSTPRTGIQVQAVSHGFGAVTVLRDVSLSVERGAILGLLGPSGAGKTTLVRLIAGADAQRQGTIHVEGVAMPSFGQLGTIGYMAQSDALYADLSGRENMEFFGALYGLRGSALAARIAECGALVDLAPHLDRVVRTYSGGMKRRLSLATSILHQPRVLILDEPTVGIDPVLRHRVWAKLRAYADAGACLLVTTHVMDEAERCDRVAMMRDGAIIALDDPAHLKQAAGAETMEAAFLHFSAAAS